MDLLPPVRLTPEEVFVRSVNRALLFAVGVGGLAAGLLALALSRRILRPVDALTAAAHRLEQGDLSQRVAATGRDEIGQLAHAFNAMADSLSRNEQLRRHMVTDVAHELRTPLSNVRGYLEALRDGVAAPTPELIESLYEEALLLTGLVDDLQELTLAEAGQLTLAREAVAPAAAAQRAAQAVEAAAAARGVEVAVDVPPDLPAVDADPKRLGQVLRNLLANAVRHTPAGGQVTVAARARGGAVEVAVRDTGEGIAPAHLPYVFERFYRADRSRARATGGAGLGLAIVKQLVEAHGGRVAVASAPGQGATFTVTLPAAAGAAARHPAG
jgi:signal transduction histidine kinase